MRARARPSPRSLAGRNISSRSSITQRSSVASSRPTLSKRAFAQSSQDPGKTHFGFKSVDETAKQTMVNDVFHQVANNYDLMNDVMSAGVHRVWKDRFVHLLKPVPGNQILDLAGGTGDIAFRCVRTIKSAQNFFPNPKNPSRIVVYDINESMLKVGEDRANKSSIAFPNGDPRLEWVAGNAEELPFQQGTFDAVTIAFGIRNCTHIDKVIEEAFRVLRPGGRFMCLEFSTINNSLLRKAYDVYSFNIIPILGQLIVNDRPSYQYLVESIRQFPTQWEFAVKMEKAGFSNVSYENLSFGVAAIHSGFKLLPKDHTDKVEINNNTTSDDNKKQEKQTTAKEDKANT